MNRAGFSITGEPRLLTRPLWSSPSDRTPIYQDTAFQDSMLIASEAFSYLAFGAGRYVTVGFWGRVHYTDDRITWTSLNYPVPINGQWKGCGYGPPVGLFIVAGNVNGIYSSPTGVTWTLRNSTSPTQGMECVEWVGDRFIACGFGFNNWYSTDGIAWTQSGVLPTGFPDGSSLTGRTRWVMIVGGPGRWLMSNEKATDKLATSTDGGATWGTVTMPANQVWNALGYNGQIYIAAGGTFGTNQYGFAVSYNGTDWTLYPSFSRGQKLANKIIWTGRVFVAMSTTSSKYYWTSPNGLDWIERYSPPSTTSSLEWIPCAGGTEDDMLMIFSFTPSTSSRPKASTLTAKEVVHA